MSYSPLPNPWKGIPYVGALIDHIQTFLSSGSFGGAQGNPGIDGLDGQKGDKGDLGLPGLDGLKGDKGDQGIQGNAGIDGLDGAKGDKGDTGSTGSQGLQGNPGIDGLDGQKGDKGDIGSTGSQGIQGNPGLDGLDGGKGDTGAQGIQGNPGTNGTNGAEGLPGLDGQKGDTGLQGIQGLQGIPGIDGNDGNPGVPGIPGIDGTNGNNGSPGVAGSNGLDGLDATLSPDTKFGFKIAASDGVKVNPTQLRSTLDFTDGTNTTVSATDDSANDSVHIQINATLKLDYTEKTTAVSVTTSTEGTAVTAITGASITLDGATDVTVEFFCPDAANPGTGQDLLILLLDGATVIGRARVTTSSGTIRVPVTLKRRLTAPAAGSHQYIAKAFTSSGTGTLNAGTGGAGAFVPMYLLVQKAG